MLFFSDFNTIQCTVTNLKEYWPYTFQVTAVVKNGQNTWKNSSGFSSYVTTNQGGKI